MTTQLETLYVRNTAGHGDVCFAVGRCARCLCAREQFFCSDGLSPVRVEGGQGRD